MLSRSKIFLILNVCFIIGVAVHSFFYAPVFFSYIIFLIALILIFLFWQNKIWRLLLFCLIFIFIGFFRYELSIKKNSPDKIQYYNDKKITFASLVTNEPDIRVDNIKLTVASRYILGQGSGQNKKISGLVLVTAPLYPAFRYGDFLKITCSLQAPAPFSGFSYDRYLARYDIYSLCYQPEIVKLGENYGNYFLAKIFEFKNRLINLINLSLPEPHASLFSALLLGVRRTIPPELLQNFNTIGITHLIAISGQHIILIMNILMSIAPFFYLKRKVAFYLISFFIIFYITLIGFPASAVRAAIMGFLLLLAQYLGRLNKSAAGLIFVASLMIFINPKLLRDDVGFQLSCAAVLGLIYFLPIINRRLEFIPEKLSIFSEALSMTIAAQIMTLPLIIYQFGRLSIISVLANVLIVPTMSIILPAGFLALLLASFLPAASIYLFFPVYLVLSYIIILTNFFASFPYAAVIVNFFPASLLFLSYLIIAAYLIWHNNFSKKPS